MIDDFCFIQFGFSNGSRYSILIHEGDSLNLVYDVENQYLYFTGDNASGQIYLNNFKRTINVDSIFSRHLSENTLELSNVRRDINSLFFDYLRSDIDELKSKGGITSDFGENVYKDMEYAVAGMMASKVFFLIKEKTDENLINVNINLYHLLDSIYDTFSPRDKDVLKFRFSSNYITNYYYYFYNNKLSNFEKSRLLDGYSEDTFGTYSFLLAAPDYIQQAKFGSALLFQLNYGLNEFNKTKMYAFILGKFPNSQYLGFIKDKKNSINKTLATIQNSSNIFYIDKEINSLNELVSLPELKGKKIYIDIWATWCSPCKMEFQYKEKVDSLAYQFGVTTIYISIDKEVFAQKWQSDIENFGLKGYHLLANEKLIIDIQEKIYNNNVIEIPRYVFIDANGKTINSNAPRPSNSKELKELFSGKEQ